MKISELNPDQLTDKQMADLLYNHVHDDMEKGDCILVFGSRLATKSRLPKAIQLYREGRAKKILFSGGTIWGVGNDSEAIY